jgi:hypothetical protein
VAKPHPKAWQWFPALAILAAWTALPALAQEGAPAAEPGIAQPEAAAPGAAPAEAEAPPPVPEREIVRDVQIAIPVLPPAPATELVRPLICPPQLRVFGTCPVLPGSPIVGTRIDIRH